MSEHYLSTKSTHDRWNRDLAPQIEVEPGDVVKFDCFDSSGGQINANSTVDDFLKIDRSKIHTLTGPVVIKGAKPGDTLRVHVLNIQHKGWGLTSITPGLGFLRIHQVVNVPMVTVGATLSKTLPATDKKASNQ